MASKMYPLGMEIILETPYDIEGELIKFALTTDSYDAADDVIGDISAVVGTAIALTNPVVSVSSTTLKFDADDTDLTWSAVAGGSSLTGVICYYDGATKPLVSFNEFAAPVATNGGDITVTIHSSGIFTIAMA